MIRIFLLFAILIYFMHAGINEGYAQIKDVGLPFVTNYTTSDYNAETQNWCITQDSQHILYFANNAGLVSFNGNIWQLYPLPNNSIVRTVKCIDNRIYASGFNEFGYFKKDENGSLIYHSISVNLSDENKNFDEIWRIYSTPEGIVFQSYLKIFIYSGSEIKVLQPKSRFGFSYIVDSTVYVIDREFGLYAVSNKKLVPFYLEESFFVDNEINFIIKGNSKSLLIGTTNKGVFNLDKNFLTPWKQEINDEFIKSQIYTGIELTDNKIAIGTIQNGVFIISKDGNVIQHLNRSRGLQNNTVLSLFSDNYKNLWLGLDNGIDMLEINSPFTILNYSFDIETTYTSIVNGDILYIGTNQGLFAKKLSEIDNHHLLNSKFHKVVGTQGQVWKLKIIDGELWCGYNFGTFHINGFEAKFLSQTPGGWNYTEVPWDNNYVIGGNYSGLELFKKSETTKEWESLGAVKGINESCKEIIFDNYHNLWITHGLKGIFKVSLSKNLNTVTSVQQYDTNDGLPALPYYLVSIKKQVYLLANDSIFSYNSITANFEYNIKISDLFRGIKGITRLVEDDNGDIWFFTSARIGVLRLMEDGNYIKIIKPFMRLQKLFISGSFENVYNFNKNNTFIGGKEGMLHYSQNTYNEYDTKYNTYVSEILISVKKNDTTQNLIGLDEQKINIEKKNNVLSYKFNSISFKFFTPYYEAANQIKHSYRLRGFDEEWSKWGNINFKEYTNLWNGKYIFEVKAINIYNAESSTFSFPFTIKPPFYRTVFAYVFYIILFISTIFFIVFYYKLKLKKTRRIDKLKHTKELVYKEQLFKEEVELSEKKIEHLEQEKLKSEMRHKNMELANSTMNLIQKNKLLNSLKTELLDVAEKAISESVKRDLRQINIRIDKAIKNDQNLKVFDKYFERVHQDFINSLKKIHPDLTPKDVRLCAYLRMNLETKEIAQLMNISTRGLEISRYRLRKKFDLERDINLVDYIMKI